MYPEPPAWLPFAHFIPLETLNPGSLITSLISNAGRTPRPLTNLTCDHCSVACPGQTPVCAAHLSPVLPAACPRVIPTQLWVLMASALASNRHHYSSLGCRAGAGPRPPFAGQTFRISQGWSQPHPLSSFSKLLPRLCQLSPARLAFGNFPNTMLSRIAESLKKKKKGMGEEEIKPIAFPSII